MKKPPRQPGQLRIIGGTWRSRLVNVAAAEGVRPTPDRIRETLFNWLTDITPQAHCLDLFAGSGVLALEALSRGAASAVIVDSDRQVVQQLRENLLRLQTTAATIVDSDACTYLQQIPARPFDVVFLDPPFSSDVLPVCISMLEQKGWLSSPAFIYIESSSRTVLDELPPNWIIIRSKKAGQVAYHLVRRSRPSSNIAIASALPEENV